MFKFIMMLSTLMTATLVMISIAHAASVTAPIDEQKTETKSDTVLPDEAWLDALEQEVFESEDEHQDDVSFFALLSAGGDNKNNRELNARLRVLFGQYYSIDTEYGQTSINDSDNVYRIKKYDIGFGSANAYGFNWHISTRAWGKKKTIETSDSALELSYQTVDLWYFSVLAELGNVELFAKPEFSRKRSSINSDRTAWGLNIAHDTDTGAWWLSYLKRDYERGLPALKNRRVLQSILQSTALDLAYALSSDEYSAGYQWFLERADLSVEFSRVTSAVDQANNDFLTLQHRYYLNTSTNIQTSLQQSLGENLFSLTVGLGLLW